MKISPRKALLFGTGLLTGLALIFFHGRMVHPDTNLSSLVATIFSVLAGFLTVALNMVTVTRPEAFKSKASRRQYTTEMTRKIRFQNWLLYSYLFVLIFVFYAELLTKTFPTISGIFEVLYLGLSAASLIWSLSLPGTLMQLQNDSALLLANIADNEESSIR